MVCPPCRGSCLPLSPTVSLLVCLVSSQYWMACPPFQGLVSPIVSHLPSCFPCLDGVPAFSRCLPWSPIVPHCSPFSPIVSPHVCLCWMVCPPSRGLVSPCLPLSPFLSILVSGCLQLFPIVSHCLQLSPIVSQHVCLCWMVHLPEVLFFIVSHCLPRYACLCWMVCPPSRGLVSPCLPTCVPVLDGASALDGVSAFPRSCLPLSACVGWCVRLPEVLFPLVSHLPSCFPLLDGASAFPTSLSPLVSHCLLTCEPVLDGLSASPRSCLHLSSMVSPCPPNCLPLSPFLSPRLPLSPVAFHCFPLSPHMCACVGWCLRLGSYLPSRGLVSPCLPLSPHTCACVGRCVPLPKVLSPLVSRCFPTCVPVTFCDLLCWMVRPPSRGFVSLVSQLVSQLVFLLVSQLVSQLVCLLISLCGGWSDFAFFSNSVLLGVLKAFLRCPPWCWMVCPPSQGLVSYLVSQLVSLLVSLCGGWSHFAFFPKECAVKGS